MGSPRGNGIHARDLQVAIARTAHHGAGLLIGKNKQNIGLRHQRILTGNLILAICCRLAADWLYGVRRGCLNFHFQRPTLHTNHFRRPHEAIYCIRITLPDLVSVLYPHFRHLQVSKWASYGCGGDKCAKGLISLFPERSIFRNRISYDHPPTLESFRLPDFGPASPWLAARLQQDVAGCSAIAARGGTGWQSLAPVGSG